MRMPRIIAKPYLWTIEFFKKGGKNFVVPRSLSVFKGEFYISFFCIADKGFYAFFPFFFHFFLCWPIFDVIGLDNMQNHNSAFNRICRIAGEFAVLDRIFAFLFIKGEEVIGFWKRGMYRVYSEIIVAEKG